MGFFNGFNSAFDLNRDGKVNFDEELIAIKIMQDNLNQKNSGGIFGKDEESDDEDD